MSIITFWNNNKKSNIGQTSSLVATATLMAVEHNYKILLISPQLGDKDLDKAYGVYENAAMKFLGMRDLQFNSGIEGIMKLVSSGKLTPTSIGDFTKIILKDRLEVISGKKETDNQESQQFNFTDYIDVLKIADKYYDMVFVDLDKGLGKRLTRQILEISNLIICNMEQKLEEVQRLVELQKNEQVISGINILYLLNKYEKNSKYNAKNIMRNSGIKKDLYVIPYDYMYGDVLQEGTVDNWMLNPKIRKATIEDEHGFFITEVNKFCEAIIYKLQELHILG